MKTIPLYLFLAAFGSSTARANEPSVIYFALTDRFSNGLTGNDIVDACFDPAAPNVFHGGDLDGLRQHLSYLQELGATDLWITPVQRQVGSQAVPPALGRQCAFHGYWPAMEAPDDGAIEPRLGGEAALHSLIAEMHRRGMRLIVDYVVNHAGYGAPVATSRPDWFHDEAGCSSEETCALLHLPDFAHERSDVADYLSSMGQRFVQRFAFDGMRVDAIKHVPASFFRDSWIPSVRRTRPALRLIGELFDESGYAPQLRYLSAGFDGLFDFPMRRALVDGFGRGGSLDLVAATVANAMSTLGARQARARVTFIDNHDVPRFSSEMTAPFREDRYWLALGALFTTPGIPQLYYGDELGMEGRWPENRRDMPAWAFDPRTRAPHPGYLGDPAKTFEVVRKMIALRAKLPALHAGDYVELWRQGGLPERVYAFERTSGASRVVVVFHDGDAELRDFAIPIAGAVPMVDALGVFGGASARAANGALHVTMPPRSLAVFVPIAVADLHISGPAGDPAYGWITPSLEVDDDKLRRLLPGFDGLEQVYAEVPGFGRQRLSYQRTNAGIDVFSTSILFHSDQADELLYGRKEVVFTLLTNVGEVPGVARRRR